MFSLEQKLIGLLITIVAAIALVGAGYHYGSKHATARAELKEAKITAVAVAAQFKEDQAVIDQERSLRMADRQSHTRYFEEVTNEKAATARTISDLRRDVIRLRVPIRSYCDAQTPASGSAAGGPGAEGHAELTADAGEFVVSLLARGDDGIRKHGEVVDRYERLRLACMADPTPEP